MSPQDVARAKAKPEGADGNTGEPAATLSNAV